MATNIAYAYGIGRQHFEEMWARQAGKCACCGRAFSSKEDRNEYNIDHNHVTGEVRAILCTRCNIGVGYVEDVEWLQKARAYLNP